MRVTGARINQAHEAVIFLVNTLDARTAVRDQISLRARYLWHSNCSCCNRGNPALCDRGGAGEVVWQGIEITQNPPGGVQPQGSVPTSYKVPASRLPVNTFFHRIFTAAFQQLEDLAIP